VPLANGAVGLNSACKSGGSLRYGAQVAELNCQLSGQKCGTLAKAMVVGPWYRSSILSALWDLPPERFASQAFWDTFEQILPEAEQDLPLEQAQLRLLALWKEKQL
jgi:hypothetical protein